MAEQMTATARLETGMRFDAEAGSGHHLTLDAAEHAGGHNAAHLTHTYRIVETAQTQTVLVATP